MAIKLIDLAIELGTSEEKLRQFAFGLRIGLDFKDTRIDRRKAKIIKEAFLEQEKKLSQETQTSQTKKQIEIPEVISVRELAEKMDLPAAKVIAELMKNKIFITLNEEIDFETAAIISEDLGFEVKHSKTHLEEGAFTQKELQKILKNQDNKKSKPRPPIVVLMGHIDHGKTSLLDAIRNTNVAEKEIGGITQAISFCQVKRKGKLITFIDTPGHEAFSKMRQQGAFISDLVILVVAADDGVKPQTKEAINYILKEKIPLIVAINKIDKKDASPDKVKRELAENNVLCEGFGGKTVCMPVSAKTKKGLKELLEMVLLTTEIEEKRAGTEGPAFGTIIEAHLDKNKGPVAMAIVQAGTLKESDSIVSGEAWGSAKRIEDFKGKKIEKALPGTPVLINGFIDVPEAGEVFQVVCDKMFAREKALSEFRRKKAKLRHRNGKLDARVISHKVNEEKILKLPLIIKADKKGSLKAITDILETFKTKEVEPLFLISEVGNINEGDVIRAEKSGAKMIGFKVEIMPNAKSFAEREGLEIKIFEIIYDLIEYVKKELENILPKEKIIEEIGKLKVLKIFMTGKKRIIIGGKVISGKAVVKSLIRIKRGGEIVGSGILSQLQQNMKNVSEVKEGNECGIALEGSVKIQEGDTLEFYQEIEKERKFEEFANK